jgi:hypothetical protein
MGVGTCLKCGHIVTVLKSGRVEAHEAKGATCEGSRKPPRGQL